MQCLILLQGDEIGDGRLVIAVVGETVVGFVDSEVLRQEAAANFQRRYPCRIGLKRQCDQLIEHRQIFHGVLIRRLFEWSLWFRKTGPALTQFETFFDIADRSEILV